MESKTKRKKKTTQKKRSDLWLPEAAGGRGNRMKVVKSYKLPVIRQIHTRDVMHNMTAIVNTAVWYI